VLKIAVGGFLFGLYYPLVNVYITMEDHHFEWENQLLLWQFSIALLVYQRVSHISDILGYTIGIYSVYWGVIKTLLKFMIIFEHSMDV
jgi:hypothetical protein